MITVRLIGNICICICCGIGFLHGIFRWFGKDTSLFLKAVTGAMGCMMSGRLFSVVLQLCGGKDVERMNLGYLGVAGCFLFLYSATREGIRIHIGKVKNRALYALSYIPVLFLIYMIISSDASAQYKVLGIVVAAALSHCTMYLFMYVLVPEGDDGYIKMLRSYGIAALVFSYAQLGEIYFSIRENTVMLIITYVLFCLSGVLIVPLLDRFNTLWEKKGGRHE